MNVEAVRDFALKLPHVTEDLPFGPDTLVFRVGDKIFALIGLDNLVPAVNLKCEPELALQLREQFVAVTPGYHMNKKHWNTIVLDSDASWKDICEWIKHSYQLVLSTLPKKVKDLLI